jgi:hypothetical protein
MHRLVTVVLVSMLLGFVGCGGSEGPPTTTVATGERVSAERYLADTASAAESVRAFAAALDTHGTPATKDVLVQMVPKLDPPLAQAQLASQRLGAEIVTDQRLESQRGAHSLAFAAAVGSMQKVRDAAASGDATATRDASTELAQALVSLQNLPKAP